MGIDHRTGGVTRAVFLDRDGVINEAVVRAGRPYPPASVDELRLAPGVPGALDRLHAAGFRLIVVTNQPDIARGRQTRDIVDAIHDRLRAVLPLDDIRLCPHDDADGCGCRKPAPGMIEDAALAWNVDLAASFMVGDRWRDVEAGRRAGCRTIFVDGEYAERRPTDADFTVRSLSEAADIILRA